MSVFCLHVSLFAGSNADYFSTQLSKDDQFKLKKLWKHFITETVFPYTLFCDKPVSWDKISLSDCPKSYISRDSTYLSKESVLRHCWELWKSHVEHFSSGNFLFFEEKIPCHGDYMEICLVNKQAFTAVVNRHLSLFQQILNRPISAEALLSEMEKTSSLRFAVRNNHLLLGILLGFGEYNPTLFQKRDELQKLYNKHDGITPKDAKLLKETQGQIKELMATLQLFGNEDELSRSIIQPVRFVADPEHQETKDLAKKYRQQQQYLALLLKNNSLEVVLQKLQESSSTKPSLHENEPHISQL